MKKISFLIIIITFLSCVNKQDINNPAQYFIDVENNKDFKFYFNNLSEDYINILKKQFKSNNNDIIFDSIVSGKIRLINNLKSQNFNIINEITDSIKTSNKNLLVIRYNTYFENHKKESQSYVERFILQISINNDKKFIPYNPILNPEIDSLLIEKYTKTVFDEVQNSIITTQYSSDDDNFKKIKAQIDIYSERIKKGNDLFLEHIYPPLIESYLKVTKKNEISSEDKKEILNTIKNQLSNRNLTFENLIIKSFNKIDCSLKQKIFLINYVLQLNGNLFIKGKMITIEENNKIYFIEVNAENLKQIVNPFFSDELKKCIEKSYE